MTINENSGYVWVNLNLLMYRVKVSLLLEYTNLLSEQSYLAATDNLKNQGF